MSLRAEELTAYLDLADECTARCAELADLYEAMTLARGSEAQRICNEWNATFSAYRVMTARCDRMREKLFREDPEAAAASIAAAHLGSLSRRNPTEAQQRASRENGKKGGRR
jgi:hypothetical protein